MEYSLNKYELKLLKLSVKAQKCTTRKKAKKLIKKSTKLSTHVKNL